jgi:uncharacterized protein
MGEPREQLVPTPVGDARVDIRPAAGTAAATLVLGHGAGAGMGSADLMALADGLPPCGITVIRVDQPWVVAGKRVAPAPATLDKAWLAVVPQLAVKGRLVVGGRSAGARVACRTAAALGASAVVALSFPLHPPGSAKSRLGELAGAGVPTLVVQGDRDPFGRPEEFPIDGDTSYVVAAVRGDHGLRTGRARPTSADLEPVVAVVAEWLLALP